MRDKKSLLLLSVSLLLLLVSFVLLCTWGYYRYYYKSQDNKSLGVSAIKDSAAVAKKTIDSIQKFYSSTIKNLNTELDSTWVKADSLNGHMDTKFVQFNLLRNEIADLLKTRSPGNNFDSTRKKIIELQQKITDLGNKNKNVINENNRLNYILEQLTSQVKTINQNTKKTPAQDKSNTAKPLFENGITASDVHLSAVMVDGIKELETAQAQKTEKLVGSITVKNNAQESNSTEVYVIVLQPDGRIMQNSEWESGLFNTDNGKKVYSSKIRFDYNSGEVKKLNFSLITEKYQKGNYTMQVYHNGKLIGRTLKTLS
ncbi:MAG: hypothetical protein H0W12_11890 [Chitinophagaceae bacterium]|nr:hypothetical protein [Chitinophagaceae bacterium]